ncbi:MAG: cellulase family glycosylhydrolase [Firmicutes bacterium]|nr:cellulase family glycosylhydrolase [Bacillota bacterium]
MWSKVWSGWVFLLALIVLCIIVIPNLSPKAQASTQAQITAAMGAGWNLGNTMEAFTDYGPSETAWGNPTVTPQLFTAVKNAGFKTVRIPVTLLKAIGPAPDYTIDPAWLGRVKEVVDYAYNQGLYVILDGVHGDGYHTINGAWLLVTASDQAAVRDKFKKIWTQYANTFKDYDEHLIFESMNEIFDGNYYDPYGPELYGNLNAYNQVFVDAVRQTGGNNASRWLLVPGWNTNIDHETLDFGFVIPSDNYRSASIPSNEKRIMISAHYYSPYEFCLDNSSPITQWGSIATDPSKKSTWGQEDYMDSQFYALYQSFVTKGYPVVIGEWCATDKTDKDPTNNTYRAYFCKTLCANCKKYGAVPVYWDIGAYGPGGSGLIDRKTYAIVNQPCLDAIMSGINANVTPPPPAPFPSPTPTPKGPGAKITVLYKCTDTGAATSGIRFNLQVRNDDTVAVPLSNVKIRYWYTRDDGKWQGFNCYYAVIGSGNIYGNMVRLGISSDFPTADFYAEVRFGSGAGNLAPGANTGEIQITLNKYDNSSYNQTNDYSFNSSMIDYGQNLKITGYVNDVLVFGSEPSGSTPPPTATPTPTRRVTVTNTPTPTRRVTVTNTPTPTRRVTVTNTPTPTRRVTVTNTPTPTNTPAPTTRTGGYAVAYVTANDWGSGATINVTITNNTATAVNGWTLAWTFPGNQTISNLWCGTYTQSGASVSVKDAGYNATIGANGGSTNFGFNINYSGTNAKPTSFTLNGVACQVQ